MSNQSTRLQLSKTKSSTYQSSNLNDDVIGLSAVEITKLFMVPMSTAARKMGKSVSYEFLVRVYYWVMSNSSEFGCIWMIPSPPGVLGQLILRFVQRKFAFTKRCTPNSSLIKFSNPRKRRQVNRKRFGPILNQTNHAVQDRNQTPCG